MRVLWAMVRRHMAVRGFDSGRRAQGVAEDVWRRRRSSRTSGSVEPQWRFSIIRVPGAVMI